MYIATQLVYNLYKSVFLNLSTRVIQSDPCPTHASMDNGR